jgi:tRNA U34 5-methylaminomethyl-2-thiouridine-forming methyltransferase MnmC
MQRKIIITNDGSHSIYIPELDERYHSAYGAVQESKHVFIEMGLKYIAKQKSEINILEIGLGTGLNALLTFIEAQQLATTVNYTALEAYPVSVEMALELNYADLLNPKNSSSHGELKNSHAELVSASFNLTDI